MIGNLVYLYLLSLLAVLLNKLEELDEVMAFDLAHTSGEGVISLEDAIEEIEQNK
ncbi:MAG: hypothetical protein ACKO9I_14830 [Sphaerospermopsis kisseleviana]